MEGIDLRRIRARRIDLQDFERSDLILAMDHSNIEDLHKVCPSGYENKIDLLLSYLPGNVLDEVPDPYYGSYEGFVEVFNLISAAVAKLVFTIDTQG
jgi:protein-tyrosine phosphatase